MRVLEAEFVKGFMRMADDGWQQGWHERNGGNLSYRMTAEDVAAVRENLSEDGEWKEIGTSVPGLADEYFTVTGSGKYFINVDRVPEESFCILKVDSTGTKYQVQWGLTDGGRPTSELPTHLMNHEVKKRVTGGLHRVIYHAHCNNIIALTFVLPLKDEIFTRELWESMTECPVVFPEGVGVVPWMVPGGREIGVETSKLMEEYNAAIWSHHGIFCSGETFDSTFGLMHTIEKAAQVLVMVMSVSDRKRQTIKPDDFRRLAKEFGVTLPEKFLYEKESDLFSDLCR